MDSGSPSASQRALDAFYANDPNRPASTLPASSQSRPPERMNITDAEAKEMIAAGYDVQRDGNGGWVLDLTSDRVDVSVQAPPQRQESGLPALSTQNTTSAGSPSTGATNPNDGIDPPANEAPRPPLPQEPGLEPSMIQLDDLIMGPLKLGAKILGSIGKWVLKEGADKAVKEGAERVVKEGVEKAVKEGGDRVAKEGAEASSKGAGKAPGRAEEAAGRPPTSSNKPEASGPTGANAAQAVQLQRQLASEAGTAEVMSGGGAAIAGAGTDRTLRDAPRLAAQYGGEAGDWAKVTSEVHKLPDGTTVEVHAYRNVTTGQTVEPKSKVGSYSQ